MSKKYFKALSVATLAAMMTTIAAPAFAATGDFFDKTNQVPYNAADYRTNATAFNALLEALDARPGEFVFENGGKGYNYDKMLTAIQEGVAAGKSVTDAFLAAKADPANSEELPAAVVTVKSVSAINSTTIEVSLNKAVTAEDGLKITIDGDLIGASQIAYGEKKVTITVPALVDDQEYAVVVKDAEDTELFNNKIAYDFNIPTQLKVDSTTINAVVGEEVSVTYTLVDEDGDAIEGQEIRVQAKTGTTINEQELLTTDAEGKVTFTYSTIDAGTQTVEAVAVSKPTVRKVINVDWVASSNQVIVTNPTAAGFIVDTNANVDAETQTIKYTVKFADEQGQPIADGKTVYVNIDGLTAATAIPTSVGDDEFVSNSVAGDLYSATLANGDGTAVLEFTANAAVKLTPTFYYAGDDAITAVTDFTNAHARNKAKTVEVVDGTTQKPTFTLELKSGKNDNAGVEDVDGTLNVAVNSAAQFKVTAKDQYGNPFIGSATLSHNVALDDIASNDAEFGAIQFDIDELDGGYSTTGQSVINFGTLDADGDGVVELQASTGAAGNKTKFTLWFDKNGNSKLDSGEGIESKEIKFVAAVASKVASMEASADETAVIEGNAVTYTVDLKGTDGKAFNASTTNAQDVIVKLYKDGKLVDQTGAVAATGVDLGTTDTLSVVGKDVQGTVDTTTGKFSFTVTPTTGDAGSEYYAVVYIDLNGDGAVQADETVSVKTPKFNVIQQPDAIEVKLTNVDNNELVAGELVDLTVTATDSGSVATKFNGSFDLKLVLAADTAVTTSPAKSYIRSVSFNNGVATVSVPAELVTNDDIKVTLVSEALSANIGTATDNDIVLTAGEASELDVQNTNELIVTDAYGNIADYDFSGVATFDTTDATASVALDAENKAIIKIVDGVVFESDGTTAITFADNSSAPDDTLTITFANGDVFVITAE